MSTPGTIQPRTEAPEPGPVAPMALWQGPAEQSWGFEHPNEVIASPALSREEKRALLASWASDAWAVESAPALRQCPGLAGRHVPLDDVLTALRALDADGPDGPRTRECDRRRRGPAGVRWLTPRRRTASTLGCNGGDDGGL
jgi:hypothetical protein